MSFQEKLKIINAKFEFSNQKKQTMLDMIAEFLHYGISMYVIFNEILPELYPKGSLNLIVSDLSEQISQGGTLSKALSTWFGMKISAIVRSGEESNDLYGAIKLAVESLNPNRNYIAAFLKKVTYSAIVLCASYGLVSLFFFKVMPAFLSLFADQKKIVPEVTAAFMSYGHFLFGSAGLIMLVTLIVLIVGTGITILFYTGSLRDSLDKFPVFSLYRQVIGADLLEQLGFYFKANILLDSAVRNVLDATRSPYLKMQGTRTLEYLEAGVDNIAEALDTGLFDRSMVAVMLAMGRVNRFESKCLDYARWMQQETINRINKVGTTFSMIFMLCGFINIIWSLGAMFLGIAAIQ